jgi:hypothetical protein
LPEFGLEWNGILASAYSLIMDVVTAASGIVCCQARMIERVSLEIGYKGLIVQLGVSKLLFTGDEVDRQYQVVDIVYLKSLKAVSF